MARFEINDAGLARLGTSPAITQDISKRLVKVERTAKRLAPVDTGRLRSSITRELHSDLGGGLTGTVGTDVEYAAPVELGHRLVAWGHETGRHVPAQPFLRPAMEAARGDTRL